MALRLIWLRNVNLLIYFSTSLWVFIIWFFPLCAFVQVESCASQHAEQPGPSGQYIPGLSCDPHAGTYEFRDGDGTIPKQLQPLSNAFMDGEAVQDIVAGILNQVPNFSTQ